MHHYQYDIKQSQRRCTHLWWILLWRIFAELVVLHNDKRKNQVSKTLPACLTIPFKKWKKRSTQKHLLLVYRIPFHTGSCGDGETLWGSRTSSKEAIAGGVPKRQRGQYNLCRCTFHGWDGWNYKRVSGVGRKPPSASFSLWSPLCCL